MVKIDTKNHVVTFERVQLAMQASLSGDMLRHAKFDMIDDEITRGYRMIMRSAMTAEVLQDTSRTISCMFTFRLWYPETNFDLFKRYINKTFGTKLPVHMKMRVYKKLKQYKVTFKRLEAYPKANLFIKEIGGGVRKEYITVEVL